LSKMGNAEVEHVKAFLSRRVDRARMAYGRMPVEWKRQCIIIGTTNERRYFRDTTGNRRYWPIKCGRFDLRALKRERKQLWAEAAAREAAGESIRLNEKLWAQAGAEQSERLVVDPYFEVLQTALAGKEGKIRSADLWTILEVKPGSMGQGNTQRLGKAMEMLGWRSSPVKYRGELVRGYIKGAAPYHMIWVDRTLHGGLEIISDDRPDDDSVVVPFPARNARWRRDHG
jgi:predicted P-loop ATPase